MTRRELPQAAALAAPRQHQCRGRGPVVVAHTAQGAVTVLELGRRYAASGDRPIRTLDADEAPQHVTFGVGRAFVASGEQPSVSVHSLHDGARRRRTATPLGSYNVQQAAGRVLTPSLNHGTLTVLDPAGRVLRQVRVARAAHDACVVR